MSDPVGFTLLPVAMAAVVLGALQQVEVQEAIGLGNVDNTSDANKPASTATMAAIASAVAAITKASIGLGNVNNTTDVNKPVSTAQAAADAATLATCNAAIVAGLAALNASNLTLGLIPLARYDMNPLSGAVDTALNQARVIPHTNLNWFAGLGTVYGCWGPGRAIYDIDLYEYWKKANIGLSGWGGNDKKPNYGASGTVGDTFVSWATGNDSTGNGSWRTPYKTVQKALSVTTGIIWVMPGYSKEDINLTATMRTVGAGAFARPVMIKGLGGPHSCTFVANDLMFNEMTWTVDGTFANTYAPGVNPTKTVLAVLHRTPALGPDDEEAINGYRWEPLPNFATRTAAGTYDAYWTVESGTPHVRFGGQNIDTIKNDFFIVYSNAMTLTDTDATMQGTNLYWQDIDFMGCKMPYIIWDPAKPAIRPINVMKRCNMMFGEFSNFHAEGAITHFQDCKSWYSCQSDGINLYIRVVSGTTWGFQCATINCDASYNGTFVQKSAYAAKGVWSGATAYVVNDTVIVAGITYLCIANNTNQSPPNGTYWVVGGLAYQGLGSNNRNCQGYSGHLNGTWVHVNDKAHDNFGQNVAHVVDGLSATIQQVWMIGMRTLSPYSFFVNGVTPSTYQNVQVDGQCWRDNCQATGLGGNFGMNNDPGGVYKEYNCTDSGNSGPRQILGTRTLYTSPQAP